MISAEVASVLNRLRGQGSDFEFLADVLTDALAAQTASFTGFMELHHPGPPTADVEPPDYVNLKHDLPSVLSLTNEYCMFKPGDQGPSGGYTSRIVGTVCVTPNRVDDVVIHAKDGTIICKRLIVGGKEVLIEDCP